MSEIFSPGSVAGPAGAPGADGAVGPSGSAAAVSALSAAIMPNFVGQNLFDYSKVAAGLAPHGTDGTLISVAGGATNATGLMYCPGATSMISNLPVDGGNWGGEGICLYDANGTFMSVLPTSEFSSLVNGNTIYGYTAWALPGTQTYVRLAYVPSFTGNNWTSDAAGNGVIYATITGTATIPGYKPAGVDTIADVNAKNAVVTANAAAALAAALTGSVELALNTVHPVAPFSNSINLFNPLKSVLNYKITPDGTVAAVSGIAIATIYCPNATGFITNVAMRGLGNTFGIGLYDANGVWMSDISTAVTYATGGTFVAPNAVQTLPGTQTYLKFTYATGDLSNAPWDCLFFAGNVAQPCITSLPSGAAPFSGTLPSTVVKSASQLGCIFAEGTAGWLDNASLLNAFLATASATNPIKLILDGMAHVSGLVISANGYTTIEGLGAGTGITVIDGTPQDGIRIGAYTSSTGSSEGAYNVTLPSRTAVNIALRNFTIDGSGQANAAANQPVTGAPAHTTFGVILTSCTDVVIDSLNFATYCANYCICLSNVARVKVSNCSFTTAGFIHDGLHIDGPSTDINISDCYFSTGDDAIALNGPEGYGGDISRVTIANCIFNGSLSVLRIYTSLDAAAMPTNNVHRVRNVAVSNCVGSVTNIAFVLGIENGGLTSTSDAGQIQDLTISNCTIAAPTNLVRGIDTIGTLTLRGVNFIPTTTNTAISLGYSVGELVLDGVAILRNGDGNAAPNGLVTVGGAIDRLSLRDVRVVDQEGSSYTAVPYLIDAAGTVAALRLDALDLTHVTSLMSSNAFNNVTLVRGTSLLADGVSVPDSIMDNGWLYLSSNDSGAPSIKVGGTAKRLTLA
jgi:hypothetical protein